MVFIYAKRRGNKILISSKEMVECINSFQLYKPIIEKNQCIQSMSKKENATLFCFVDLRIKKEDVELT
jgi:hypothetical protein